MLSNVCTTLRLWISKNESCDAVVEYRPFHAELTDCGNTEPFFSFYGDYIAKDCDLFPFSSSVERRKLWS